MHLSVVITLLFGIFFHSPSSALQVDDKSLNFDTLCKPGDGCKRLRRRSSRVEITHHQGKVSTKPLKRRGCDANEDEKASGSEKKKQREQQRQKDKEQKEKEKEQENEKKKENVNPGDGGKGLPPTNSLPQKTQPSTKPPVQAPVLKSTNPADGKAPDLTSTWTSDVWLAAHNKVRSQYNAPNLVWSDKLAANATIWSKGCYWEHSSGQFGEVGENLAAGQPNPARVLQDWVYSDDECAAYDPANPIYSHFTQVVWASSKSVGCGYSQCKTLKGLPDMKDTYMFTCQYDPPGNYEGEYGKNVFSKKGECKGKDGS